MNITLILPSTTQPRFHKRIDSLSKEHNCKIYAFDRGLYKKNALSAKNVILLGKMRNKNYFKRISTYFILARTVLKNKKNTDLFYFFTIDFAILGYILLGKKRYIYEIGDFAYLGLPKFFVNLLTNIDLKIIKKSYKTILTSEGFRNRITSLNKGEKITNLLVIPNKPAKEVLNFKRKTNAISNDGKLKFGFVGILRYPNTVYKIVKIIADRFPNYEFVFYGDGGLTKDFIKLCETYKNLHYRGQFKNPTDLEKIYNDFDIHVACYDITGLNQQIAEPNKLYESIYFGNPLIVTKKSFLGEKVMKNNIGYAINDFSEENLVDFLEKIEVSQLNIFRRNMLDFNKEDLVDSDEKLLSSLRVFKSK